MYFRNRKYDSGYEKRKKKQRLEAAAQSQKGALDKFVLKESQINSENQTQEADIAVQIDEIERPPEVHDDDANIAILAEAQADEIGQEDDVNIAYNATGQTNDNDSSFQPDIFDPRMWNALDSKIIDILVQKGPKRDLSIEKGPKDKFCRRFFATMIH